MADHLAALVRANAFDRYIAALFAAPDKRDALFALYAFDIEISRICDLVHDPLPGEIRLQWWRDVVNGERDGEAAGHPVASALLKVIKDHDLPRSAFDAYCEARIFEFYADVMPDQTALEAYLGATQSSMIQLSAMILDRDDAKLVSDAAGHAGVAVGIAQITARLAIITRRSQGFVPQDMLAALGTSSEALFKGEATAQVPQALAALSREHLAKFEVLRPAIPVSLKPAFLHIALVPRVLKSALKSPDIFSQPAKVSQLARMFDILRAAMK